MLDFAAKQGYAAYPMLDNVIQPEVVDDGAEAARRRVRRQHLGARRRSKSMKSTLDGLPADRKGSSYK